MSRDLPKFVGLSYVMTWIFTIPFVVLWRTSLHQTFPWWVVIFLPGAYGPSIAALILTWRRGGRPAVTALLRSLLRWRLPIALYAAVLLAPMVMTALATLLSGYHVTWSQVALVRGLGAIPVAFAVALPFGPLPEELGWRGYALPRLLREHRVFVASVILGVIWTFWHTPMFWFPGAAIPSVFELSVGSIMLYLVQMIAETCLFTITYLLSGGSVLLAVLQHLAFNTSENILFSLIPEPSPELKQQIYLLNTLVMWVVALVALRWWTWRTRRAAELHAVESV
jgi:membrane protease YdiL (CAAX protease family)